MGFVIYLTSVNKGITHAYVRYHENLARLKEAVEHHHRTKKWPEDTKVYYLKDPRGCLQGKAGEFARIEVTEFKNCAQVLSAEIVDPSEIN